MRRRAAKIFRRMPRRSSAALLAAALTGGCCWFLPAGDPPEGNILENPPRGQGAVRNTSEAADYFIASLTMALLEHCPGEPVGILSDPEAFPLALKVLRESGRISGTPVGSGSGWTLTASREGDHFSMRLEHSGGTVWSDRVTVVPGPQGGQISL